MKQLIIISLLFLSSLSAEAQIAIARYFGEKKAAITFTFDDGLQEHYTEVFPRLKQLGLKASFGIIGSKVGNTWKGIPTMTWEQLREMAKDGQEITSHGWAHHTIIKLSGEKLRYEVQHNDSIIYQNLGFFPKTYFYPGNRKTAEGVEFCSRNRVGTRTFQGSFGSKRDSVWVQKMLEQTLRNGEWTVTMTHGITQGYDAFKDPKLLWNCFTQVANMQDCIWVATLHDVLAYNAERKHTKLETTKNKKGVTIVPHLSLDKHLFTHPLTLVVDYKIGKAKQDGKRLKVIYKNGKSLIDINPNGGKIWLQASYGG